LTEPRQPVPALRLQGIRKNYGPVIAVDGIDLEVGEGEFFTLARARRRCFG
jgi:putative spermidine/putrescine transport system ATP-binding protein